jgi:hypothetical protein
VIDCDRWCLVVADTRLMEKANKYHPVGYLVRRVYHLNRWFTIMSTSGDSPIELQFSTLSEFQAGRKTYVFLLICSPRLLFKGLGDGSSKDVLIGLQLEKRPLQSGEYKGFSANDDGLLSLLCAGLSLKLGTLQTLKHLKTREQHHGHVLEAIGRCLEHRTLAGVLTALKEEMPMALGYDNVSVIYCDRKSTTNSGMS